jgi:thiol-disulfide isomerase/thioredoxin
LDSVYSIVKPALHEEKYRVDIEELYSAYKRVEPGNLLPNFEFSSMDGDTVSLKDLKGKLVYIDIWATWCIPCIGEMPKLKKLATDFKDKNIQFASISAGDPEEKWRNMVMEKELKAIQLLAPLKNNKFFDYYLIRSIPRFILLDAEGKIIDGDAKRPSNPALRNEIEQYL